jgi:hypothetical protein
MGSSQSKWNSVKKEDGAVTLITWTIPKTAGIAHHWGILVVIGKIEYFFEVGSGESGKPLVLNIAISRNELLKTCEPKEVVYEKTNTSLTDMISWCNEYKRGKTYWALGWMETSCNRGERDPKCRNCQDFSYEFATKCLGIKNMRKQETYALHIAEPLPPAW